MADITDKYLSRDIDAQIKALKGQGKTLSTSKSLAKLYDDRQKLLSKGGVFGSGYSSPSHFYRTQKTDYMNERSRLMDALGINSLRDTVSGLVSNINDAYGRLEVLPTDVQNESRGFDVNAAQRRAIESQRATPIGNLISQLGRSLDTADTSLRFKEGEMVDQLSIFADFQAREATGFDKQREYALVDYLSRIQRQQALSDREWQQAADLAKMEKKYDLMRRNELAKARATRSPLEVLQGLGYKHPAYAQTGMGGGGDLNQEFEQFSGGSMGGGGGSWGGTGSSILNFIPNAVNSIKSLIGIG